MMKPECSSLPQSMKYRMSHSSFGTHSGLVWVIPLLHMRKLRLRGLWVLPQVLEPVSGGAEDLRDPNL